MARDRGRGRARVGQFGREGENEGRDVIVRWEGQGARRDEGVKGGGSTTLQVIPLQQTTSNQTSATTGTSNHLDR